MHTLRWWTFEGDAWQITRDARDAPAALAPAVYADFDAALALAATYDIYYDFVLFSAPTAIPMEWITDAGDRAQLASALAPLFRRYRSNPHVLSWEVFNEPELDVWADKIAEAPVRDTVRSIAAAVHENSTAYVTVGSAMLDGLPMWIGTGLDYYEAHWYDYMSHGDYCAACTDFSAVKSRYGLDAPLVIGELYAGPDTRDRFETFYRKGYAGAWPWSLFPENTNDRLAVDMAQAGRLAAAHDDLGPRAGSARPVSSRTPAIAPRSASPAATASPSTPASRDAATPVPIDVTPGVDREVTPDRDAAPGFLSAIGVLIGQIFDAVGTFLRRIIS